MKTFYRAFFLSFAALISVACSGGADNKELSSATSATPQAARPPRETLPKIIAFGDSLTAGYGLSPQESYPTLLQRKLDADGYKYEVVNVGVSGETSAGGVRSIDWALSEGVRFVIIELGANDHLRGMPVAETKKNLSEIIRRARAKNVKVVLAGMLPVNDKGDQYAREVSEMYRHLAREHNVALIPFFLEGVAGVSSLNLEDGIHPNAEGTKIVAENVYRTLRPLLDEEAASGAR